MPNIGSFILSNLLYILLLVASVFGYFWIYQNRKRLQIKDATAALLALLHTMIGVFCVTIFAFIESGEFGGRSLFGGILFMPCVYYLYARLAKKNIAAVFDSAAVLMVFTLFCARIACFPGHCCLGALIPGSDGLRWPTREAELLFYVVLLVLLGKISGKKQHYGTLYPLLMVSYGAFRFIVEWFRETESPILFFHISHIWCVVSVAVGLTVYIKIRRSHLLASKKSSRNVR